MATDPVDRTVLPVPDPPTRAPDVLDAKDAEAVFPQIEPLRPPEGAPNVLVVLLDDVGFGASSAFGGPCVTPTLVFSGDETTDLGHDSGSPVGDDYSPEESVFTGTVNWVQLDVDEAAAGADHLISPEERLRVAMARQ